MRTPSIRSFAIGVTFLILAIGGCGDPASNEGGVSPTQASQAEPEASVAEAAILWPAPPDPLERTVAAGLEPGPREFRINHVHAHLDVFIDGKAVVVPAGIGINIDDPSVRHFNEPDGSVSYGGIEMCAEACISPLHTHHATGIIHTESSSPQPNTLGQFFTEWGVEFSDTCVGEHCSPETIAIYVDGELYTGDPRAIELTDQKEIAIVIGTPPTLIPKTADFSQD
jgi:hypothetical protein